jgi:hypothetical protein
MTFLATILRHLRLWLVYKPEPSRQSIVMHFHRIDVHIDHMTMRPHDPPDSSGSPPDSASLSA